MGEVAKVLADGVTASELARTRQRLLAEAIYARDSLGGAARVFGSALTCGEAVGDVEAWPARIAAVTLEQVHAAARHVFRPGAVGDRPSAAGGGRVMLAELLATPPTRQPAVDRQGRGGGQRHAACAPT